MMATFLQVKNFITTAVTKQLAGNLDDEYYEYHYNGDDSCSYVDCEFDDFITNLNNRQFEIVVDREAFIITINKPRKAVQD